MGFSDFFAAFAAILSLFLAERGWAREPVYFSLGLSSDTIIYHLYENNGSDLSYHANTGAGFSLVGEYDDFSLGITVPGESSQEDIDRYGKTTGRNWSFNRFEDFWGLEVYYHQNHGFYLENQGAADSDDIWVKKSRLYRPDVNIQSYGLNLFYSLFPADFSLKTAFSRFESPKHWGWSPIFLVFHDALSVASNGNLVPASHSPSEWNNYRGGLFTETGLGAGAGIVAPIGPFSVSFSGTFGLGLELRRYDFGGPDTSEDATSQKHNYRLVAAYKDGEYFAGGILTADIKLTSIGENAVDYQTNFVELYVGRAF